MRNPWAWHASWYSYIRGDRDGKRSGHRIEHELFQKMNFRDYILSLDDPDVPVRVIRADVDLVGSVEDRVPL